MSKDIEKYRNWIRQSQNSRSAGIYYMGKALIQELGEEKGTEMIIKQTEEMGHGYGTAMRKADESQGKDNDIKHFFDRQASLGNMYAFAWEGGTKSRSEDDWVVEWSYCPIAEGFKNYGELGVRVGELFCEHIDNALAQGYNSDYECVRESSLNHNGLCTLHFKKKQ